MSTPQFYPLCFVSSFSFGLVCSVAQDDLLPQTHPHATYTTTYDGMGSEVFTNPA